MMSNKFLEQYAKSKAMPPRLLLLITYAKTLLAPTMGIGFIWTFIELVDIPSKSIIGVVGTAIIAFFTYLATRANARTRVEVKTIETNSSASVDKTELLIKIFEKATEDIEKSRQHFTSELKEQRNAFFEKEKDTREHYENRKDELMKHFEDKETELREKYHTKAAEAGHSMEKCLIRLTKIEIQLKNLGIHINDNAEIILPENFERRKSTR